MKKTLILAVIRENSIHKLHEVGEVAGSHNRETCYGCWRNAKSVSMINAKKTVKTP
jgi:hypothetical protein